MCQELRKYFTVHNPFNRYPPMHVYSHFIFTPTSWDRAESSSQKAVVVTVTEAT